MSKQCFLLMFAMVFVGLGVIDSDAQASRKSVSGAEVTGTFSHSFPGKFKGSSSDIKILAIGNGKIKVSFDLVYPHLDGKGELTANTGQAEGEASIVGDTAVYSSKEFGPCTITIKFVRPGTISVSQEGADSDCGFGHNVMADGTFRKVNSRKPKF
jgi:hypothetical protein